MTEIDLARALVTEHAYRRWAERVGLPAEDLAACLRRAVRVPARERAAAWRWLTRDRWYGQAGGQLRYCPRTRAVFLLKRDRRDWADGSECWAVVTVTTLDLAAAWAAGRQSECATCPAASA